jgi:hypothetical protein
MDFRPCVREHLSSLRLAHQTEIVEELAQHLEDVYQEATDSGLDHSAALARAVNALPAAAGELDRAVVEARNAPPARLVERFRDALDEPGSASTRMSLLNDLRRDFRYGLRTLAREPGLTAAVAITLALGIGGTSTVFSAIDAVLLRDPPVTEPDRVVVVFSVWAARATARPEGRRSTRELFVPGLRRRAGQRRPAGSGRVRRHRPRIRDERRDRAGRGGHRERELLRRPLACGPPSVECSRQTKIEPDSPPEWSSCRIECGSSAWAVILPSSVGRSG